MKPSTARKTGIGALVLAAALLAVNNPSRQDFKEWMEARTRERYQSALLHGSNPMDLVGTAMADALTNPEVTSVNLILFSVFTVRRERGKHSSSTIGVFGRFIPLGKEAAGLPQPHVRQEKAPSAR